MDTPTTNHQSPTPSFRVAIYARTGREDRPIAPPIEAQLALCRAYAVRHRYLIVQEVLEPDRSDASLARPGIIALHALMGGGAIDGILVAGLDRLVGEPIQQLALWAELAQADVEVINVKRRHHGDLDNEIIVAISEAFGMRYQLVPSAQEGIDPGSPPADTQEVQPLYWYVSRLGEYRAITAAQAARVLQICEWALDPDHPGPVGPDQIRERLREDRSRNDER